MSTQTTYATAVGQLVPGGLPLTAAETLLAIAMAVNEHSTHKPRVVVEDFDGDGGFEYAISEFASYTEGLSAITSVEYPVDDDDETPATLDDGEWMEYRKPAGKYLRFLTETPAATEAFRVTYTALHTCTALACTIDACDDAPVQALAAAYLCTMLSTYYAQSQDSSINADSVDHKSQKDAYEAKAKAFRTLYLRTIGQQDGQPKFASVTQDQDVNYPWGGDRLTHPRRRR